MNQIKKLKNAVILVVMNKVAQSECHFLHHMCSKEQKKKRNLEMISIAGSRSKMKVLWKF